MKCKTPDEVIAHDLGVLEERGRIALALSQSVATGGIPFAVVTWNEETERLGRKPLFVEEILKALEPAD